MSTNSILSNLESNNNKIVMLAKQQKMGNSLKCSTGAKVCNNLTLNRAHKSLNSKRHLKHMGNM
mgnify:CR=1 FL=1|jgi:hypothetical protein